ncbi:MULTISPECIES: PH domain-containing protein [Legionella]|uniref:PH domain-containing protein n=1 Tax=Legionella resiliens TaxID=2905958 RepID=A0ABS8X7M7_9GAMM|nr:MULTISPECIES: PH domain-containing protein [unclassified Legionella]MCE0724745.1 PH domain-containing protein [Legionella sp. 9fVS26]MCE3533899.1 PH domain-containing protein [Legionella sp. 8cVS16]QLZ70133.1 membrane protein [Legionella sp. PC1000]
MFEKPYDSNVIFFTRMHWIIFLWPALALCGALAIVFYVEMDILQKIGYGLAALALLWIGMTWMTYYFSSVTIKKNHVIIRTGVVVRQTIDIPLSKIEAIDIRQSILGSMLSYGMICITGTGGTRRIINFLHHPLTCRRYIEQLLGELRGD